MRPTHRAEYIRRALESQNSASKLEAKRKQMKKASERVRRESMRVLGEFEELHDELP
jgi:hypothetical protein